MRSTSRARPDRRGRQRHGPPRHHDRGGAERDLLGGDAEARLRQAQEALRQARIARRLQELRGIQGYWSRKARDKGILTEQDLARYLAR